MKTKNICKFIPDTPSYKLDTYQFIYEANISVMEKECVMKHNRIILIKSGEMLFVIDNFKTKASTGDIVFVFAGEIFCVKAEEGAEYLYIDFGGSRSDALFKRFGINVANRIFGGFDGLVPLWHDSLYRASSKNIDLLSESVLLYSLSRLTASENEQSSIVQQIIDITEENFDDASLSISMVAKKLSYNAKYLSHLFKQKMGVGYTEYLRVCRIKYAIMLMEHGIDSVKNIASLCGFSNPQYFSLVFKNTVGVSPGEYKADK